MAVRPTARPARSRAPVTDLHRDRVRQPGAPAPLARPAEIQKLAARTAECAHGQLTDGQFRARPGIDPAWVAFLAELCIITMTEHDLTAIDRAAQTRRRP